MPIVGGESEPHCSDGIRTVEKIVTKSSKKKESSIILFTSTKHLLMYKSMKQCKLIQIRFTRIARSPNHLFIQKCHIFRPLHILTYLSEKKTRSFSMQFTLPVNQEYSTHLKDTVGKEKGLKKVRASLFHFPRSLNFPQTFPRKLQLFLLPSMKKLCPRKTLPEQVQNERRFSSQDRYKFQFHFNPL